VPRIAVILLVIGLCPGANAAVCEMAKLLGFDGAAGDYFGASVAVSADVAVVGAPYDDDNGGDAGSAYVYRWNGPSWTLESKLLASDGAGSDQFGWSVSVSGDVAVVGARFDDDNGGQSGSAYVYRWNGSSWVETKLLASDGADGDFLGWSVAVSGDVAVVGAYADDDNGSASGSAYVYRWNGSTWVEEAKLLASDGAMNDQFGRSVGVNGDTVVVGAYQDDDSGNDAGAAYVYRWNGSSWLEEPKLLASDGAPLDSFGASVAVSGDLVVVGAPNDGDNGGNSGSVYVYRWNGWSWVETKLLASDGAAGDEFGYSVAASSDLAAVGAYRDDDNGGSAGSAYVYRWNGSLWVEEAKLLASDGAMGDQVGWSVGASGDVAVAGAPGSESAYVFGGVSGDCNGNGEADACEIMAGTASDLDGNLTPDECDSFAYNLTQATFHDSIAGAIGAAGSGDDLIASPLLFAAEPDIDFEGKAVTLISFGEIDQPAGGLVVLADGARLETAAGSDMNLGGELRTYAGDTADVDANLLTVGATGTLACAEASRLDVATTDGLLSGVTRVHDLGMLVFGGPVEQAGGMTVYPEGAFIADATFTNSGTATVLHGGRISSNGAFANSGTLIVDTGVLNTNGDLLAASTGTITLNACDLLVAGWVTNQGDLRIFDGLTIAGSTWTNNYLLLSNSTLICDDLLIDLGRLDASGEIYATVANSANVHCLGDTMVVGTYTNNGTTTVQIGTLTIVGTLTNSGTIIGDAIGGAAASTDGTQPGDGLSIAEDYVAGAGSSLLMADPVWVFDVGGDYDVATDDNTRYHMAQAELRLWGGGQALEVMSVDIGPEQAGLDRTLPGHFPVGTLRIQGGATVDMVDTHDNDGLGQALCEAIYAQQLVIEAGATLNTLGCPVYYDMATVDGAVDDPANLVRIPRPCPCDCEVTPDGTVDVGDFLMLLAQWGTPGTCDCEDPPDGVVDVGDFLAILAAWGSCP
jgi:hypothetical protein